jgi:hypothetical protein
VFQEGWQRNRRGNCDGAVHVRADCRWQWPVAKALFSS